MPPLSACIRSLPAVDAPAICLPRSLPVERPYGKAASAQGLQGLKSSHTWGLNDPSQQFRLPGQPTTERSESTGRSQQPRAKDTWNQRSQGGGAHTQVGITHKWGRTGRTQEGGEQVGLDAVPHARGETPASACCTRGKKLLAGARA